MDVDTLNTPYDAIGRMWGKFANVIYGPQVMVPGINQFHISTVKNWSSFGVQGIIVPWAIYGFSDTEVYIGAENGKIWRYNGNSWTKFAELTKDEHNDLHFENIWGESPNDLYAVGAYPDENNDFNISVIAHFSNGRLGDDTILMIYMEYVEHLYKNKPDNKIYL